MEPIESGQTIRQQIIDLLCSDELTQGKKLVEIPYKCLSCGFVFDKRSRFSKPGRCPSCKNSHMQTARYHIE
jgi:predicted Zn-ribbon and HTH transcriptional regulator